MKYDIFLSICQTEVDGHKPNEKTMFENFFDQVKLADELGFGVAWVAETHLSTEAQKKNSKPVVPHFKGEIGLNTDILQLAHKVFAQTKNIEVGSAIKNILCNGGPLAHAEAIKTFLSLHGMSDSEKRRLHIGFASGRFEFSNRPYGIYPRNKTEEAAWSVVKGKVLREATEIFLRALRGDIFSSGEIEPQSMCQEDFRTEQDWQAACLAYEQESGENVDGKIPVAPRYQFEDVGVIPLEPKLELLNLVLGSHDKDLQVRANEFLPVSVFNLSITPEKVIDETHERMRKSFHPDGGAWQRWFMPRTAMIFLDASEGLSAEEQSAKAKASARKAWENYWKAMEGTIDNKKIEQAVDNTLAGNPAEMVAKINEKYHPQDRLMLWFDFNTHDNAYIKHSMKVFMQQVAPELGGSSD